MPRAKRGEPSAFDGVDVADAPVDHQTDDTTRLRRDREDLAPVPEPVHSADVDHQDVTGIGAGDRDVDTQVVATRALHRQARPATAAPRHMGSGGSVSR